MPPVPWHGTHRSDPSPLHTGQSFDWPIKSSPMMKNPVPLQKRQSVNPAPAQLGHASEHAEVSRTTRALSSTSHISAASRISQAILMRSNSFCPSNVYAEEANASSERISSIESVLSEGISSFDGDGAAFKVMAERSILGVKEKAHPLARKKKRIKIERSNTILSFLGEYGFVLWVRCRLLNSPTASGEIS